MTFLIVDAANLYFRARHIVRGTTEEKIGLSLSIIMMSIAKIYRQFKPDHIVWAQEGHSWRKDVYEPYKRNRIINKSLATPQEIEEEEEFFKAFNNFYKYLEDHTNCTLLQNKNLEADDLISGWVDSHPNDHHVILSSDSDFAQLIAQNVNQYNGISEELTTIDGIVDIKGNISFGKHKELEKFDPEWILFKKCMKGDTSDNVFSAYPGVRIKGSKNKVGLLEAYSDRHKKGFSWHNLMNQTWVDHNGAEHKVLNDYERNKQLIDLRAQPDNIKEDIFETIAKAKEIKNKPMVGTYFLKFCGKYQLIKLSDQAQIFSELLSKAYPN